ncbi:MAG: di-heme-cytochrome C peroxidase [Geminicoccaceae bacterium]
MEDGYFGGGVTKIIYPEQNWTSAESLWFYNTSQGSDLMNYNIFINLERADSTELFRSDANMIKYRYLPQRPTEPDNILGLPVGWVKNTYQGEDYIGFTCAACHTTQINWNGAGIRVDGGPAMADMEWMLEDLQLALAASLQWEKFDRLAAKILKGKYQNDDERRSLESALAIELTRNFRFIRDYNVMNRPMHGPPGEQKHVAYGYGRLDAFGRIYNQIFSKLSPPHEFRSNSANAPVSYPALWDTPQHDYVQWNGIGANNRPLGLGPLGRNTGEVLGVFATFDIKEKNRFDPTRVFGAENYPSSANTVNIIALERSLRSLWSPSWVELNKAGALPEIDTALAETGRQVYKKYDCGSCHDAAQELPAGVTDWRKWDGRKITAKFVSLDVIGTDSTMAQNAIGYCGTNTGPLSAVRFELDKDGKPKENTCGNVAGDVRGIVGLEHVTKGVVADGFIRSIVLSPWRLFRHIQDYGFSYDHTTPVVDGKLTCDSDKDSKICGPWTDGAQLRSYKARTLNGIWATAPYLHNGSVPNLYELLLPTCDRVSDPSPRSNCRSVKFTVGRMDFDPKKVGFQQNEPDEPVRPGVPPFPEFNTALPGNSNAGHEYPGTPMNPDERWALIEYLKTL